MSIFNEFQDINDDLEFQQNEEIINEIANESDNESSTAPKSNDFLKKKRKKPKLEENDIHINSNELKYIVPNYIQKKIY
jgi:hypothetical protein